METVLSTPKYRDLVVTAKQRGFEIRFIYVLLKSVAINLERIKLRVAKGGHDVPADKVRARRAKSLKQFPWFFDQADQAWVFDNSGATPRLIGTKADGVITLDPEALPEVIAAVTSLTRGTPEQP